MLGLVVATGHSTNLLAQSFTPIGVITFNTLSSGGGRTMSSLQWNPGQS